jgi:hypothetical protein
VPGQKKGSVPGPLAQSPSADLSGLPVTLCYRQTNLAETHDFRGHACWARPILQPWRVERRGWGGETGVVPGDRR